MNKGKIQMKSGEGKNKWKGISKKRINREKNEE